MQMQDLATSLGGRVRYTRFVIGFKDLQGIPAGAGAQPLTLNSASNPSLAYTLPSGSKILGVSVKASVAFTGGALTAMTVSLGVTGAVTRFTSAWDIFQAVGDTVLQETALFKAGQGSSIAALIATFTPTTDVVQNCAAGQLNMDIFWLPMSTTFTEPA